MATTIRRVLLVLVLFAASLPWLTRPGVVLAQDEPTQDQQTPEQADERAGDPSAEQTPADDSASPAAAPAMPRAGVLSVPTGGHIAVIEIDGPIMFENQIDSVKRRVDRALGAGADLIVFDFDTPGGVLTTAIDLSSYIRTLQVPTVAWVDNQALSAGILIASACDELIMSRGSLTGDCAPILPGKNLAPTERAKALSPLLAEFRANAQSNFAGPTTSDYALFHAMCVLGVEVYQVRHELTGEVRLVSQADYAVMVDGVSPVTAANVGGSANNSALNNPTEFAKVAKPVVTVTDLSQVGQWELVQQVHDGSTLLTINETEAKAIGLSRETVSSEAEIQKLYGASQVLRYNETWSESLVNFLVHPVVRAALLLLGIAGLLMEYLSPGLIVPGVVGLTAIVVLIGAPFLVGLAQTWHLVLIVVGVGLVIYELFTMTTFGVLAILGLLMFLTGLVLSGVQTASNGLPEPGSARAVVVTSLSFVTAVVLCVPILAVLMRYFDSAPILNKLILANYSDDDEPTRAMLPPQAVTTVAVGTLGVVTSTGLRPGGRIQVDEELIDVTSTGGFIEPGTPVRVVEVHGNIITVEKDDEA